MLHDEIKSILVSIMLRSKFEREFVYGSFGRTGRVSRGRSAPQAFRVCSCREDLQGQFRFPDWDGIGRLLRGHLFDIARVCYSHVE